MYRAEEFFGQYFEGLGFYGVLQNLVAVFAIQKEGNVLVDHSLITGDQNFICALKAAGHKIYF